MYYPYRFFQIYTHFFRADFTLHAMTKTMFGNDNLYFRLFFLKLGQCKKISGWCFPVTRWKLLCLPSPTYPLLYTYLEYIYNDYNLIITFSNKEAEFEIFVCVKCAFGIFVFVKKSFWNMVIGEYVFGKTHRNQLPRFLCYNWFIIACLLKQIIN